MKELEQLKEHFKKSKWEVKRPAKGEIPHDYLVPAGPYEEHWDWDAFFVGMALSSAISSEAIYLKNWTRNYLTFTEDNGFTPGLITPTGIDTRLKHIKPFMAQAAYHASKFLGEFEWLRDHLTKIEKIVTYRQMTYFDEKTGLSCWHDSMESGADNNLGSLEFPDGTVLSVDINSFLYLELRALSKIAAELGDTKKAEEYEQKAADLKQAINDHLWSEEDGSYFNVDTKDYSFIKRHTYSNYIVLFANAAEDEKAKTMIEKYMINPEYMWAEYGIRTLAKNDPDYSNRNIIKPHSNWQGPVWPIANYLYLQGLSNYGFQEKAIELAQKLIKVCLNDLETTGGMHENYHADTGEPLAAPNFVSWNLLVEHMLPHAENKINPFKI